MTMTLEEARSVRRPPIEAGKHYTFYCEMQQEYEPPEKRLRRFTGQEVLVIRNLRGPNDPDPEYDGPGPNDVVDLEAEDGPGYFESSRVFIVRAKDGTEFNAFEEELNGWDRDLGQFFWPGDSPRADVQDKQTGV